MFLCPFYFSNNYNFFLLFVLCHDIVVLLYYILWFYVLCNDCEGKVMDSYDTMKQAFKSVDKDCSGTVERGELDRVFESFNVGHSPVDIDDLFAEYDKNGDGVFSYGEFVKIMSSKN